MRDRFDQLREAIARWKRGPSELDQIPQRLAELITYYNRDDLNTQAKVYIIDLLESSLRLSEILANDTYQSKESLRLATHLIDLLSGIIFHLNNRPSTNGYGLLFLETQKLHEGYFSTIAEANSRLESLKHLGLEEDLKVVPVELRSTVVVRPAKLEQQLAQAQTEQETDQAIEAAAKELKE